MKGCMMKVHSWLRLAAALLVLAIAPALRAQSCTISSPASAQLFQSPQPLQLTATVSSAPTAYKLVWSVDYQRWATGYNSDPHPTFEDFRDAWQGPFAVTWYTGLNGDGPHTISGVLYDIFGNVLATCPAVSFTVRIEGMSNQSISPAVPTSGKAATGLLTFDGTNAQSSVSGSFTVDGYPIPYEPICGGSSYTSQTGGWQLQSFNSACFPNGQHMIVAGYYTGSIADPYLLNKTFTSSNVTGNNITVPNHYSVQGSLVTFSSTGTLPAPLVAGSQWYWANSATNSNTVTLAIAGDVMTLTCSSNCGVTTGTPVFIRNIRASNQITGQPSCDGYYFASSGSGTSFTVTAPPGCPNGAQASGEFEVDINPYFVQYIDGNTIGVSATPGGSTITLTNGGSGTHTVKQHIRSPYWGGNSDHAAGGGTANIYQLVTFSNGSAPMEIEVPYWELHLIAGGASVSVCPKIKNTDLSFSAPACTAFAYTLVPDGGLTGVASVNSSGSVSGLMAGWAQVQVSCSACAAGGVSLPTVTVYVQVQSGSITFPHFTHGGTPATAFSPGNSFFPLSAWQLGIIYGTSFYAGVRPLWYGPMMQEANLNSSIITADPSGDAFGDPQTTACYWTTWPTTLHTYESAFAAQYGTYFEADIESTHWGAGGPGYLAALLNNTGYNRQSCFTGFLSNLVSEGRTWKTVGYDELNQYMAGNSPFRNPNLGSTDFPSVVVSGGVATYNVQETFQGVWSQSSGNGSWIKMAGAVTNTCLNGWLPVTGITNNSGGYPISFTTPTTCANGTYTESSAQLYHYWAGAGLGENVISLPRLNGTGNDANNVDSQNWDSTYFTQIVVSGGVAEFYMASHSIANGQAIRVHNSVNNLNTVKPITLIDANHFSITYNSAVETVPANGTYTSANDPSLFVSVDGNFPPTPFLSLRNLITSVSGHPATTWGAIGFTYNTASNPGVRNWAGNPIGEDGTFDYVPQPPYAIYGPDTSVWLWANYSQSSSGLLSRGYQLQPRSMLWGAGLNYTALCQSFLFIPSCDHPTQLLWRPETLVAQMMAMVTLNVSGLRLYNFDGNTVLDFGNCCGWNSSGTGLGAAINPYVSPKQWAAMAHTDALIKLREDSELQPPANKPYLGPMFLTDAHTSATYGNELKILCESEMPYGSFSVTLPAISGGTVLKYILTGYSLTVTQLAGNPSSDTDEFCSTPGRTTAYLAQPPGVNVLDNITFGPPVPLPFGAAKFLIQVGYYPRAMQDDPTTDCTSVCTIAIDHHNTAAWYRVIYANANNLPLSIGDPVKIASQGLY
jgi:hypothetical protein